MEKKQLAGEFRDLSTLVIDLRQERNELRLRVNLARCGIQKEWEKAESKWRSLRAGNDRQLSTSLYQARELKDIYIRIYRGLLIKNSNLLKRLKSIEQVAKPENITALKKMAAEEETAIRLKLETLSGAAAEIVHATEEEPVCACLRCQQETGKQPFGLNHMLEIH